MPILYKIVQLMKKSKSGKNVCKKPVQPAPPKLPFWKKPTSVVENKAVDRFSWTGFHQPVLITLLARFICNESFFWVVLHFWIFKNFLTVKIMSIDCFKRKCR